MKIKEKAKAYDKALEQAKKELNTCGSLDCDAARQIIRFFPKLRESEKPLTPFQQCLNLILRKVYFASIPNTEDINKFILDIVKNHTGELVELAKKHEYTDYQLRESEDERIIEEIKFAVMQMPSERQDTKNRCRAWLEKQKEQNLIMANSLQLKEQKPAEWSEDDEETLKDIIAGLEATKQLTYKHEPSGRACYNKWIAWLKSLRPSWKPSEDEERLINTSISFLKDFADKGYENAVECIDWLKSKLNGDTCK